MITTNRLTQTAQRVSERWTVLLRRRHRLIPPCRAADRPAGRSTATRRAATTPQLGPARSLLMAPRVTLAIAVDRDQPVAPQLHFCRSPAYLPSPPLGKAVILLVIDDAIQP